MKQKINITVDDWQLQVVDLLVNDINEEMATNRSEMIRTLLSTAMIQLIDAKRLQFAGGVTCHVEHALRNVTWRTMEASYGDKVLMRAEIVEAVNEKPIEDAPYEEPI